MQPIRKTLNFNLNMQYTQFHGIVCMILELAQAGGQSKYNAPDVCGYASYLPW